MNISISQNFKNVLKNKIKILISPILYKSIDFIVEIEHLDILLINLMFLELLLLLLVKLLFLEHTILINSLVINFSMLIIALIYLNMTTMIQL